MRKSDHRELENAEEFLQPSSLDTLLRRKKKEVSRVWMHLYARKTAFAVDNERNEIPIL